MSKIQSQAQKNYWLDYQAKFGHGKRTKDPSKLMIIYCLSCSKPKTMYASHYKRGRGKYCSETCRRKAISEYCLANKPGSKGGITPQNLIDRSRFRVTMQKKVLERDNYTCQICEAKGIALQVDHIKKWSEYEELRFVMENCRTLCTPCHYQITFHREMPVGVKTWGRSLRAI